MKRIVFSIIAVIITLSFVSCRNISKKPTIYIEKAQLSKQEEDIAKLLGANSAQRIYDFKLDNNVESIQINTYELISGVWKQVTRGEEAFSDDKGRLVLDFDNLTEGLRIALQSEQSSGSTQYFTKPTGDFTEMNCVTSILNDLTEITYEQEIPLVIQILTTQNSVSSYDVESFFTPDKYEKHGNEHIYAVTIRFSQKTLG